VHVISIVEKSHKGATMGAFSYLEKPVSKDALEGAFNHISTFLNKKLKKLLLSRTIRTSSRPSPSCSAERT